MIPYTTGHRRQFWKHNCLSVGLASGFIEPLEATSIHLIARGMDFFLRYFPDRDCDAALVREYNRRMTADFEEVRDFIVLHYAATARDDTPFWQWCRNIPLPDTLRERIELFRAQRRDARRRGRVVPRLELAVGVRRHGHPAARLASARGEPRLRADRRIRSRPPAPRSPAWWRTCPRTKNSCRACRLVRQFRSAVILRDRSL